MKLIKILAGFVTLLIVIAIAVVIYVGSNLNSLLKQGIETVGSDVLKTSVRVQSVNVNPKDGLIALNGLTIANPQGFQSPTIFSLDNIAVTVAPKSLIEKKVFVNSIKISGLLVTAELANGTTNIQALEKNLGASSGPSEKPAEGASSDSTQSGAGSPLLIKIDDIDFSDSSMALMSQKWGDKDVKLPAIHLQNIGAPDGLPPEELAAAIIKPVLAQLNKQLESRAKDLAKEKAREELGKQEDKLKEKMGDKLKGLF